MKIIAGPCQHESYPQSLKIAKHCYEVCHDLGGGGWGIDYYFKASFDKANRTSLNSPRGMGLDVTLPAFTNLKKEIPGLLICTDVHTEEHVDKCKDVVDMIQIPAFLSRQTDLILAAAKTDCVINIKKGQFMAPWDIKGIVSKLNAARDYCITERGTSFGYNRLVVDFAGISYMLRSIGSKLVFDATHSVQTPGGGGSHSGGDRSLVPNMVRAAAAVGVSSFFIEVHPDPDNAPSDGPNMIKLDDFEGIIRDIVFIRKMIR